MNMKELIGNILAAVAVGAGVGAIVLNMMNKIDVKEIGTLLGIGLTSLAIAQIRK